MNKFYNFNYKNNSNELYLYGAIIDGEKWDESEVNFDDFKQCLDNMSGDTLDIFCNTPGGSVFATQSIIALIDRCKKKKGTKVNFYIDSLCASCGSWLISVADNVYIHNGSTLMMHLPMTFAFGANKQDLAKEIELLNKIEDQMVSDYMKMVIDGVTEDDIRNMLSKETWLCGDEIGDYFKCTKTDSSNAMVACVDKELFKNFKNVPQELLIENKSDDEEKEIENKIKEIELALAMA